MDAATAKIYDGVLRRAEELGLLSDQQREIYRSYTLRWRWNDNGEEVLQRIANQRTATLDLDEHGPDDQWNLTTWYGYDVLGRRTVVTGLIAVPDGPAPAQGRPLVAWAHGTTGTMSLVIFKVWCSSASGLKKPWTTSLAIMIDEVMSCTEAVETAAPMTPIMIRIEMTSDRLPPQRSTQRPNT